MVIKGNKSNFVDGSYGALVWFGQIITYSGSSNGECYISLTSNTLKWYSNGGASYQCNGSYDSYNWVAFG